MLLRFVCRPRNAYFEFRWTQKKIRHLADNFVTPDDFEYVVLNANALARSRSSGLPAVTGPTRDGQVLFCVFEIVDDLYCDPITAFWIG